MTRPCCQHPVDLAPGIADTCDKPANWETNDLAEVHYLCERHCAEALQFNDFRRDEVGP